MQYAGAGIFRILQELRVDPRICLLFFRPALFLKSRHVYRGDLLLADFLRGRMVALEAELEVGAGKQRGLMRLIRGMIQCADRAIAGIEFATELVLQSPVDVIGKLHAGRRHGHDASSKPS